MRATFLLTLFGVLAGVGCTVLAMGQETELTMSSLVVKDQHESVDDGLEVRERFADREDAGTAPLAGGFRSAAEVEGAAPSTVCATSRVVTIRVVRAGSEAPVAGAEIFYGSLPVGQHRTDFESHLRSVGKRKASDVDGMVEVPVGTQVVVAVEGARWGRSSVGQLFLSSSATKVVGPLVLRTSPVERIAVRTVDASGRPVPGMPIGLSQEVKNVDAVSTQRLGVTCVEEAMLSIPAPVSGRLVVDLPGLRGCGVDVDSDSWADGGDGEPLQLVVPAVGRIEVRVTDDRHVEIPEATVQLAIADDPSSRTRLVAQPYSGRTDESGAVSFASVGLGRSYEVRVFSRGRETKRIFVGPVDAVRPVEVAIMVEDPIVALSGRACAEDGRPFVGRMLILSYVIGATPGTVRGCTDDHGGFRFDLPRRLVGQAVRSMQVELLEEGNMLSGVTSALSLREIVDGEQEFGAVRFERTPVVVAGRVHGTDERRSVARLSVERMDASGAWESVAGAGYFSLGGGDFEFRGHHEAGRYRLLVSGAGPTGVDPLEFTLGDRGIQIEL